jgi:hypothetical protein
MNNIPFDRLVDGELSEEERRDLLAGLDNEPGGWRRCALAFLEAQCWKQTFCGWAGKAEQEQTPAAQPTVQYKKKPSPWVGRLGTVAAVAASFVAALWIGSAFRDWSGRPGGNAVQNVPGVEAVAGNNGPSQTLPLRPEPAANPWQVVTVSPSNGPGGHSINLPAREDDRVDEQWSNTPSAIPSDVMQALARTGHQVKQQRELVPVSLQDGRQMVMPVDQVDVHYVGRTY